MKEKVDFSEFKCGCRKQRSKIDQIFIVKAIIDNQKFRYQNTYMLFGRKILRKIMGTILFIYLFQLYFSSDFTHKNTKMKNTKTV